MNQTRKQAYLIAQRKTLKLVLYKALGVPC
jgi:hypothetical protein